nr:hypothetical protein [Alteromonas macleodii]
MFRIIYWYSTQQQSSTTSASLKSSPSNLNRIHFPISAVTLIFVRPAISSTVTSLYKYPSSNPPPHSVQLESDELSPQPIRKNNRKYKWTFTGTPHKSSRHDLLFQFSDIKPFFCHKTEKFNTKIISVDEMSEILSSTEFLPCPNGFFHPETYRLYEALQCGCVPIVENAYKYYERLFPDNPFIKVDKWIEAKHVITKWENERIKQKREECNTWWNQYKNQLQEFIKNKIKTPKYEVIKRKNYIFYS